MFWLAIQWKEEKTFHFVTIQFLLSSHLTGTTAVPSVLTIGGKLLLN